MGLCSEIVSISGDTMAGFAINLASVVSWKQHEGAHIVMYNVEG